VNGRRRYAARLLVVVAIIAVVVGLGFVWRVSPAASIVSNDREGREGREGRPVPAGAPAPDEERFERRRKGDGGLSLGSVDEVVQTMLIGVGVMAVVVLIDRTRRRRRASAAPPLAPRR